MRGLAGPAIVALSTGFGLAGALDTATAVIPFDLGQLDFGRELTLLLTVAEAPEACGASDIQINGQALSTQDGHAGRDTVYEDYGSELVASWSLECTEVDRTPAKQSITVQIDSVDGVDYDDLVFTVAFHQASPIAILGVDGPLVDFPALDLTGGDGHDFWAQHYGQEGSVDGEVAAAVSEIQFLRIQQREIGERIKVLEKFIEESDAASGACRGRLHCLMKSVLRKVAGMASKAYETVMGPGDSHGQHHGNGTHAALPPPKRPLWRPPFCPCAPPSSPPTAPPPDPAPEVPLASDDKADGISDGADTQSANIEPPSRPELPPHANNSDAETEDQKAYQATKQRGSSPATLFLVLLIFLLVATIFLFLSRAKQFLARRRRECALRRRERRNQRIAAVTSFFRRVLLGPRAPPCRPADMEQQPVPPPTPPPEDAQRTSRAQSNASNTMEQDLAQFRAAVDMVGSLVAGGESRPRDGETGTTVRRAGLQAYPQDLPPAYQSEDDEDAPMLSAISDGFRSGYGSSGYAPGQAGSSSGNADALGYSKP